MRVSTRSWSRRSAHRPGARMTRSASVSDALRSATEWLRASGSRSPRLDAELLLATALGVDRAELFRRPERVLTRIEERRFDGYLVRRQAREPVAYIRGPGASRGS